MKKKYPTLLFKPYIYKLIINNKYTYSGIKSQYLLFFFSCVVLDLINTNYIKNKIMNINIH